MICRPERAEAHSPGQAKATPWVITSHKPIRPVRAKAFNYWAETYAFALAGRPTIANIPTQGVAPLALGYALVGLSARGSTAILERCIEKAKGSRYHNGCPSFKMKIANYKLFYFLG